nr:MAG TPA: hypothetical protein [Caudoviricetes sp.]
MECQGPRPGRPECPQPFVPDPIRSGLQPAAGDACRSA